MAIPERARALPKFSVLGLGEPFIANLCGKWLGLRLNGCFAAIAVGHGPESFRGLSPSVVTLTQSSPFLSPFEHPQTLPRVNPVGHGVTPHKSGPACVHVLGQIGWRHRPNELLGPT